MNQAVKPCILVVILISSLFGVSEANCYFSRCGHNFSQCTQGTFLCRKDQYCEVVVHGEFFQGISQHMTFTCRSINGGLKPLTTCVAESIRQTPACDPHWHFSWCQWCCKDDQCVKDLNHGIYPSYSSTTATTTTVATTTSHPTTTSQPTTTTAAITKRTTTIATTNRPTTTSEPTTTTNAATPINSTVAIPTDTTNLSTAATGVSDANCYFSRCGHNFSQCTQGTFLCKQDQYCEVVVHGEVFYGISQYLTFTCRPINGGLKPLSTCVAESLRQNPACDPHSRKSRCQWCCKDDQCVKDLNHGIYPSYSYTATTTTTANTTTVATTTNRPTTTSEPTTTTAAITNGTTTIATINRPTTTNEPTTTAAAITNGTTTIATTNRPTTTSETTTTAAAITNGTTTIPTDTTNLSTAASVSEAKCYNTTCTNDFSRCIRGSYLCKPDEYCQIVVDRTTDSNADFTTNCWPVTEGLEPLSSCIFRSLVQRSSCSLKMWSSRCQWCCRDDLCVRNLHDGVYPVYYTTTAATTTTTITTPTTTATTPTTPTNFNTTATTSAINVTTITNINATTTTINTIPTTITTNFTIPITTTTTTTATITTTHRPTTAAYRRPVWEVRQYNPTFVSFPAAGSLACLHNTTCRLTVSARPGGAGDSIVSIRATGGSLAHVQVGSVGEVGVADNGTNATTTVYAAQVSYTPAVLGRQSLCLRAQDAQGLNVQRCVEVFVYAPNPCDEEPCKHDGLCEAKGDNYTCLCPYYRTGRQCETWLDPCLYVPCMYGGTCVSSPQVGDRHVCVCTPGFSGYNCEVNIDDCESSPCYNGATCLDLINGFRCACGAGFSGTDCSTALHGLFWTDSSLADNATVRASPGDTVTLSWQVRPGYPGDAANLDVQWFYAGRSSEMMAVLAHGQFLVLPAFSGRLRQLTNAGLELSGVRTEDSGQYSVEVVAGNSHSASAGQGLFRLQRTVNLLVE